MSGLVWPSADLGPRRRAWRRGLPTDLEAQGFGHAERPAAPTNSSTSRAKWLGPSTPASAGPAPRARAPRGGVDHDRAAARALSGGAVDHDPAAGWITTRAPLKHHRRRHLRPPRAQRAPGHAAGWLDALEEGHLTGGDRDQDLTACVASLRSPGPSPRVCSERPPESLGIRTRRAVCNGSTPYMGDRRLIASLLEWADQLVGPRPARTAEPADVKILPLRLESSVVERMDDAWRARGIKNRIEFFRRPSGTTSRASARTRRRRSRPEPMSPRDLPGRGVTPGGGPTSRVPFRRP